MDKIELMISKGRYQEAGQAIDAELAKKDDARLHYLRALVSYKSGSHEYAAEEIERALFLAKEPDFLKLKAMLLIESLEFKTAAAVLAGFANNGKDDAEALFLLSVCMMFTDDSRGRQYLKRAYLADKKKTKAMLEGFYRNFFKSNRFVGEAEKKSIEEKIAALK